MRSSDLAKRFAAALLLSGVLAGRLRELGDLELGQVLDREVCSSLSVLAPELTVCMEAADRLCRHREDKPIQRTRSTEMKRDDGEHLLHAESALYRAGIPHLLLPFQRDRFASDMFFVPRVFEARAWLLRAGFRSDPGNRTILVDRKTNRAIRIIEAKENR